MQPWSRSLLIWSWNHRHFKTEGWNLNTQKKGERLKAKRTMLGFWGENGPLGRGYVFITLTTDLSNIGGANQGKTGCGDHFRWTSLRFHVRLRQSHGFPWLQKPRCTCTSPFLLLAAKSCLLPSTVPFRLLGKLVQPDKLVRKYIKQKEKRSESFAFFFLSLRRKY